MTLPSQTFASKWLKHGNSNKGVENVIYHYKNW